MVGWRQGLRPKQSEEREIILLRMEASFILQSNHEIMDEEEELGSMYSLSEDEASSNDSTGSSASEFIEDATSSNSCASSYASISSSSSSSSSSNEQPQEGPLYEMSSLIAQLPLKRGLSKHFQGKSQSFACLSDVRCLEDLAKPEKPCRRKMKSSKSYGGGLDSHKALSQKACSRTITKKASRGYFSSLSGRKRSFLGSRPPATSKRISSLSNQSLLFA